MKSFHKNTKEWLETNGLGSAISGTSHLANTSKYHGLLVGLNQSGQRITLVNNLEVWLEDEQGKKIYLSSHHYIDGVTFPNGEELLSDYKDFPWPIFEFDLKNGDKIIKEIFFLYETNQVMVKFSLLSMEGPKKLKLIVRPLMSGRSYFDVRRDYEGLNPHPLKTFPDAVFFKPFLDLPSFQLAFNGKWREEILWYYNHNYAQNINREEDGLEHLWSPGEVIYQLDQENAAYLLLETEGNLKETIPFLKLQNNERLRRELLLSKIKTEDLRLKDVAFSSENFLFKRPDGKESILAGFPWFLDWGRDTFISMEGLLLIKGRVHKAHFILKNFSLFLKDGLLPNTFLDLGSTPLYNSVDAPLWFIHMVGKTLDYGNSLSLVEKDLWPAVISIINHFIKGTSFEINVDPGDGLLFAGSEGFQVTWMDAKFENLVITPRIGKPIEVNALWYRALVVGISLGKQLQLSSLILKEWEHVLKLIKSNFEKRFFDSTLGHLVDVADALDEDDARRLRPNALYVLALAPDLLSKKNQANALRAITDQLLTPYGLRTLSYEDPDFYKKYQGDLYHRDLAYHQGTVWPYLIGVYVDAFLNVKGAHFTSELKELIGPLLDHAITNSNGFICEIFDGAAPHRPVGAFAQGWSSAEVLRVAHRLGLIQFDFT